MKQMLRLRLRVFASLSPIVAPFLVGADQSHSPLGVNISSPAGLQITTGVQDRGPGTFSYARFGLNTGISPYNDTDQRIVVFGSGDNGQARTGLVLEQFGTPGLRFLNLTTNGCNTTKIPAANGGLYGSAQLFTEAPQPLQLGTSNAARLTVDAAGNVGIGTSVPTSLLTLPDRGAATMRIGISDNRSNAVVQILGSAAVTALDKQSSAEIVAGDSEYFNNGVSPTWSGGVIRYYGVNVPGYIYGNQAYPLAAGTALFTGQNVGKLAIGVNGNAPIVMFNSGGTRLTIDSLGNVGVGRVPSSRFEVGGDWGDGIAIYQPSNNVFGLQTALDGRTIPQISGVGPDKAYGGDGNNVLTLQPVVGFVGIGTTTPKEKLEVNGVIAASGMKISSMTAGDGIVEASIRNENVGTDYRNGSAILRFGKMDGAQLRNHTIFFKLEGPHYGDGRTTMTSSVAGNGDVETLTLRAGNVGIGTTAPTSRLHVVGLSRLTGPLVVGPMDPGGPEPLRVDGGAAIKGSIRAKEIVVTATWADYVFSEDYRLAPLSEVALHIKERKHLSGVPSASEVAVNGLAVGDMQRIQMAKIEELTLYAIAADQRLIESERERQCLAAELVKQSTRIESQSHQIEKLQELTQRLVAEMDALKNRNQPAMP